MRYETINIDRDKVYAGARALGYESLREACKKNDICYGTILNYCTKGESAIRNDKLKDFIRLLTEKGVEKQRESLSLYDAYCESQKKQLEETKPEDSQLKETKLEDTQPEDSQPKNIHLEATPVNFEKVLIDVTEITDKLQEGFSVFCKGSNISYKLDNGILCRYMKNHFTGQNKLSIINASIDTSSDYFYILKRKKVTPKVGHFYKLVDDSVAFCQGERPSEKDYTYKFILLTDKGLVHYNSSGVADYNNPYEREQRTIKEEINVR